MTCSRDEVRDVVISHVEKWVSTEYPINNSSRIVDDLSMDSDDTIFFILGIEKYFRIKVSPAEWAGVYTVGDVVELLYRHLSL